jgi:hypothetical protein
MGCFFFAEIHKKSIEKPIFSLVVLRYDLVMISKESLEQFKKLYFKNYGIKLDNKEALQRALRILNLIRIVRSKN